jgi:hypothetical protein
MAIEDFYTTLDRYIEVSYTDNYGNQSSTDKYTANGTFQGKVQARSGDYIVQNNQNYETKASILYTAIGQSFEVDEIIKQSGIYYRLMNDQDQDGISAQGHHQEIDVIRTDAPEIV